AAALLNRSQRRRVASAVAAADTPFQLRRCAGARPSYGGGSVQLGPAMLEKKLLPMPSHPFGSGEMAFVCLPGAFGLLLRIDMEHNARHLAPIRTFLVCIKEAQIGDAVLMVVGRQRRSRRCAVGYIGIERPISHFRPRFAFFRALLAGRDYGA